LDPEHPGYTSQGNLQFGQAIYQVYEKADKLLGHFLECMPDPKAVFIMSDHGFGPAKKVVFLDKWLMDQGYLVKTKESSLGKNTILKPLYMSLRKMLPQAAKDYLKTIWPGLRNRVESKLILGQIDWSRTRAFTFGVESTPVFLNTTERFPNGLLSNTSAEYDLLRQELAEGIKGIKDPDSNTCIAQEVLFKEDIYSGPYLEDAPDLLVIWKDYEYVSRRHYGEENQEVVSKRLKSGVMGQLMHLELTGCHRPEGVFMAKGPMIRSGQTIGPLHLTDVLPTLLYYLGIPLPDDLDGKPALEIFETDFVTEHAANTESGETSCQAKESAYTQEEEDLIAERLKSLGYLE
jgi:predicted AlkP superfamily phosphohydrolase/phosphomutase